MNLTTPRASDDIAVLRTRQLEATKRRIIAELRIREIARATFTYRSHPNGSAFIEEKGVYAEQQNGQPVETQQGVNSTFYDIAALIERFSLDLLAHFHSGFEFDGGNGYVLIDVEKGAVFIKHTDIEMKESKSVNTF